MFEVILLAIIQGIAEFLPISSSAHLIIFRDIFGLGSGVISQDLNLTFDIALHLGTALAIIVFFFKDFLNMAVKGFKNGIKDKEGKMMWFILAATIPAAVVGLLFEDVIDSVIRTKYVLIAFALILMGIIIYFVDTKMPRKKKIGDMTLKDAIIVGCSQVFALIPGFSRSGTTIAAGRILHLEREDAAKFSFYLSAPVVVGAVILELFKTDLSVVFANFMPFLLGIVVSFAIGVLCIKFLLQYLKTNDFKIFMWYRVALGILVILCMLI